MTGEEKKEQERAESAVLEFHITAGTAHNKAINVTFDRSGSSNLVYDFVASV